MPSNIRPTNIDVDRQVGEVRIDWNDGRACTYPIDNLREACPCAECRGGHDYMGRAYDPEHILAVTPAQSYTLDKVELVGTMRFRSSGVMATMPGFIPGSICTGFVRRKGDDPRHKSDNVKNGSRHWPRFCFTLTCCAYR
jgi:hypothetical protein